jgi:glycosyltransferase involved in cell wall biosynthesis
LRFLLAADNFSRGSGGAPRSAQELVRALLGAEHRVAVLEEGRPGGRMNWEGADHFRARLHGPLMPRDRDLRTVLLNPRWQREVAALAAAFRPRLIVTQGMLAPGAIAAARAAAIPAAYFFRGYAPLCPLHYAGKDPETDCTRPDCRACLALRARLKYPLVRAALGLYDRWIPRAELVVANSRYVAGLLQRRWGINPEVLLPSLNMTPARTPANCPEGYLLFVKPQRVKGLDLFLELARRLPHRRFAVAGEVGGRAARDLGALPNVRLLGWRRDMGEVYRGARLILGPSRLPEPFGRVFAEAAACGCPALAFRAGGIPEAVGAGGRLLERSAGADEWVRALEELDAPGEYRALCQAALEHARKLGRDDPAARAAELLESAGRRGARPRPAPPVPERRLKVVQVISALSRGGAELSLYHLVTRLNRARFDVQVVCLRQEGELAGRFRQAGVKVGLQRLPSRYSPRGLLRLARLLAREKADIVHTHLRRPNTSGRIAAWLAGTPVIIAHERNPGPEKRWRHFLVDRWLARRSSGIVAVSADTAERNSRLGGIPLERFTVIPNGVDLEEYRPGDRAAARAGLGLAGDRLVIGFAGRLHPVKKLDVLLHAVARAAAEFPELHLLLAGEGGERPRIEQLAGELGIAPAVTFLGSRDDLPRVYPAMDAFCLVSRSEGCSRAMLEAAACGLPLVLTPVGYAPEMFADGESALMVPVGDVAALAAAIRRLAGDAGLRRKLSAAALEAARAHGLERCAARLERLYLELWDRRKRRPRG